MSSQIWMFNKYQKQLRTYLLDTNNFSKAKDVYFIMNSLLHPTDGKDQSLISLEDDLWKLETTDNFQKIPTKNMNSVAWHLWHSARIEDITSSFILSNKKQVLIEHNFSKELNVPFKDTGNCMNLEQMQLFNSKININALKEYRIAVGKASKSVFMSIDPKVLKTAVSQKALDRIKDNGFVLHECQWLLDFWGSKNIMGIILMPLTRHLMVHINKSKRLLGSK